MKNNVIRFPQKKYRDNLWLTFTFSDFICCLVSSHKENSIYFSQIMLIFTSGTTEWNRTIWRWLLLHTYFIEFLAWIEYPWKDPRFFIPFTMISWTATITSYRTQDFMNISHNHLGYEENETLNPIILYHIYIKLHGVAMKLHILLFFNIIAINKCMYSIYQIWTYTWLHIKWYLSYVYVISSRLQIISSTCDFCVYVGMEWEMVLSDVFNICV